MSARVVLVVAVAALAGSPSLASGQMSCPTGWVADGARCLRSDPPPPLSWAAGSDAELYAVDAEAACVAPADGSCGPVYGRRASLAWGIVVLSTGYAASIALAALTGALDGIAPFGGDAAYNAIPLVGPTIATVVAVESGGNALGQFTFGLLSSALQLGGAILTLVGALSTRIGSRDADGREIEIVEAGQLRWAGPTGFALAF